MGNAEKWDGMLPGQEPSHQEIPRQSSDQRVPGSTSKEGFPQQSPVAGQSWGSALPCVAGKALSAEPEVWEPELRDCLSALLLRQPLHRTTMAPLRVLTELSLAPCRGTPGTTAGAGMLLLSLGYVPC